MLQSAYLGFLSTNTYQYILSYNFDLGKSVESCRDPTIGPNVNYIFFVTRYKPVTYGAVVDLQKCKSI